MRTSLIFAITVAALAYAAVASTMVVGEEWITLKSIHDPYIQNLGAWSVAEHVKQANDGLKFRKVVKSWVQAVESSREVRVAEGLNIRLAIRTRNGAGKDSTYVALLYQRSSDFSNKLVSFGPYIQPLAG
ncbi:cysteine proteinase inhibitor 8-like [Brachypodium distachyon]|uniref:Cystatin domain-containing protein n=1 Tax=Brachypodium distachyon TaxID=15368 RepID=I1H8B1_BRADI|nr:cysteine proteinase inhibitor 8-like [Brachypodium distachyon]KQK22995.1 hypothetical protein BRADI_1g70560v3 [Brachypodium distachyon]|eukprot:XP_024314864.1 cysteine proteinase inhibitor 8-like [Brachypodium distachyon]